MTTTIRTELLAIQSADPDNVLHPHKAVAWARDNPASALHKALEWDNDKAAHEYRLHQLRGLVRLHIVNDVGDPAMVSLRIDRSSGGGYRSIDDVTKIPDLREMMLQEALAELERAQRRFGKLSQLAEVWNAVEVAKVRGKRPAAVEAPKRA